MNLNLFWLIPVGVIVLWIFFVVIFKKKPDTSINSGNVGSGSNPTTPPRPTNTTQGNTVNRPPLN